jgi:hypothetical protein
MTSISVDSGNASFLSVDGVLFNIAQTLILQCPAGKSGAYTIPAGVTAIGRQAFDFCQRLTSVTIPSGVTGIGNDAFSYCTGLTGITLPSTVTNLGDDAFFACRGLTTVTIPASVTSIGWAAFNGCIALASATFEGNAPAAFGFNPLFGSNPSTVFQSTAAGFTVYFFNGATGFTTPTWYGYPAVALPPLLAVEHPAGTLLADGGTLAFGSVNLAAPKSLTVTLRNTGAAPLSGLALTLGGANPSWFSHTGPAQTSLVPGASTTITVTFGPGGATAFNAALQISSNDPAGPFDLALTGSGTNTVSPVFYSSSDQPWSGFGLNASYFTFGTLTLQFAPAPGTVLRVFNNTNPYAVTGTFPGLPQGGTLTAYYNGVNYTFTANYSGGDGNDIVLILTGQQSGGPLVDFNSAAAGPVGETYATNGVVFTGIDDDLAVVNHNGSLALASELYGIINIAAAGQVFSVNGIYLHSASGWLSLIAIDANGNIFVSDAIPSGFINDAALTAAFGGIARHHDITDLLVDGLGNAVTIDDVSFALPGGDTPAISSRVLTNGDLEITFTGVLQSSPDLSQGSWQDVEPKPASPLVIPKETLGQRGFFRARSN